MASGFGYIPDYIGTQDSGILGAVVRAHEFEFNHSFDADRFINKVNPMVWNGLRLVYTEKIASKFWKFKLACSPNRLTLMESGKVDTMVTHSKTCSLSPSSRLILRIFWSSIKIDVTSESSFTWSAIGPMSALLILS